MAFSGFREDNELKRTLEKVVLHEGLESIGAGWFKSTSIKTINIPKSVKTIGENAFLQCGALTSVTFAQDSQLTAIENRAFKDCKSLKNIDLPMSL